MLQRNTYYLKVFNYICYLVTYVNTYYLKLFNNICYLVTFLNLQYYIIIRLTGLHRKICQYSTTIKQSDVQIVCLIQLTSPTNRVL